MDDTEYKQCDNLRDWYITDYCKDKEGNTVPLNTTYDHIQNKQRKQRIFCLDCSHYKKCKGKKWNVCEVRKEAMRTIYNV